MATSRPRRLAALTITLALASAALTGQALAGSAHAADASAGNPLDSRSHPGVVSSTAGHHQTVHLFRSTSRWPRSHVHHGGGAVNLTEDGRLQRFSNRSLSPRPHVRHTQSGKQMLSVGTPPWLPVVAPTPVSTKTPDARQGWQGLNEADNETTAGFSLEPPDQGMCVGSGHVLELINDVVQVYRPDGTPQTKPVYLNDFFGEVGRQFAFDPSCTFDAGSQRFIATEATLVVDKNTGGLTGASRIDVAVSKTSDPRDGFNIYRIPTTDAGRGGQPRHRGCPCIGDFPQLGTDAHGVFVTTNEYPLGSSSGVFGNGFNGSQVYALSKAALASGSATTPLVHFENLRIPSASGPVKVGFTLWPTTTSGTAYARANHGTEYFTSSFAAAEARPQDFNGHAHQVGLWWISNTRSLSGASPRLTLRAKVLNSESYGVPPLSNQATGPTPLLDCLKVDCLNQGNPYQANQEGGLDSSDSRVLTSVFTNGHVVTALDTVMDVSGNVQAGFAWLDLNAKGAGSSIANQGYVGTAHANVIYPAIATNPAGAGVIGVTLTGDHWYPSAAYLRWTSAGHSGVRVAAAGKAPQDGFCEYLAFNCHGTDPPSIRPRWGDYGAAAWSGGSFYVANEYIAHRCSFDTFYSDPTCGGTRTFYGNFSTHIQRLSGR